MPAGHSSGGIPKVRIGTNDMDEPTMHVFVARDGISITGHMEDEIGRIVRDPQNNQSAFRFEFGIEDWVTAMHLGADLMDAAMKLRRQGLLEVRLGEEEDERSALLTPPDPESLS